MNCTKIIWIKQILEGIQEKIQEPIVSNYNNTSVNNIFKNLVMYSKTKHISIKYNFMREQVREKEVRLECVPTKEKLVDIFTNPLQKDTFEYVGEILGVLSLSILN